MNRLKPKDHHKLRTVSDLAHHIGVNVGHLYELIIELRSDEAGLYYSWNEPKKSGGTRPIDAPIDKLKMVQNRINERMLQRTRIHQAACGGVRGKRLSDNLKPHLRQQMVVGFDLKSFFPSISSKQVYCTFCSMGASPDVARILTRLTTFKDRIPEGAPTSPMIANLVAGYGSQSCLDRRIEGLCTKHRSHYTRWVDDITISGPMYLPRLQSTVERIIDQSNFSPNKDKTCFASKKESQVVTGHIVNVKPNIKKSERRKLRAILHRCRTQGPEAVAIGSVKRLKQQLRGKIAHIQSVNPEVGAKFLKEFDSIRWTS